MRIGSKSSNGLIVQPNTLTIPEGGVERMLNVINAQDDLYIKERGFKQFYKHGVNLPIYGIYEYDDYIHIIFRDFVVVLNKNTGAAQPLLSPVDAFDLQGTTLYPSQIAFTKATSIVRANDFAYFTTPNGIRVIRDEQSPEARRTGIEAPLLWGGTINTGLAYRKYTWTASAVAPATGVNITINTTDSWNTINPTTDIGDFVMSVFGATSTNRAVQNTLNEEYSYVSPTNPSYTPARTPTQAIGGTTVINTGARAGPTQNSGTLFLGYESVSFNETTRVNNNDFPLLPVESNVNGSQFGDCPPDRAISYRAVLRRQFNNGRFIESEPSPPLFAYNTMADGTWTSNGTTTITVTTKFVQDHHIYTPFVTIDSGPGWTILGTVPIELKIADAFSGSTRYTSMEGSKFLSEATTNTKFTFEASASVPAASGTLKWQIRRYSVLEVLLPPTAAAGDYIDLYFSESQVDLYENPQAVPDSDYYLAREIQLLGQDITNKRVLVDMSQGVFQKGIPLYTNPSDGDLSRKPNLLPPTANVIEQWKGSMFYGATAQRESIELIHTGGKQTSIPNFSLRYTDDISGAAAENFNIRLINSSQNKPSPSVIIKKRVQLLCYTINTASTKWIAYYNNDIAESPGAFTVISRQAHRPFLVFSPPNPWVGIEPPLPQTFDVNGFDKVQSVTDAVKNRVYWSKANQPEAVPFYVDVGASDKFVLSLKRLKDGLIVVKEDGIFSLYGEPATGIMSVREIDSTIKGVSSTGVTTLGNRVYAKTDHGVVAITESSTAIVSRKQIEPLVKGKDEDYTQDTIMYANEADRTLYMCTSVNPATNTRITYAYNFLTGSWSEISQLFDGGIVIDSNLPLGTPALNNNRFIILGDTVYRERKENTKLDWCNSEVLITVASVTNGGRTINFSGSTVYPAGWALGTDNKPSATFSLFRVVSSSPGSVTLDRPSSIVASNQVYLFEPISSVIRTAPIDGGDSSVVKHLTKFVINTKYDALSMIDIEFRNDWFRNTTPIRWEKEEVRRGWGTGAWGRFPWGNAPNETLIYLTEPSQIVQTEMPRATQKSSFIQAEITHAVACEGMFIQQMSFEVRPSSNKAAR